MIKWERTSKSAKKICKTNWQSHTRMATHENVTTGKWCEPL